MRTLTGALKVRAFERTGCKSGVSRHKERPPFNARKGSSKYLFFAAKSL
jgi:hypothetical protein